MGGPRIGCVLTFHVNQIFAEQSDINSVRYHRRELCHDHVNPEYHAIQHSTKYQLK